MNKNAALYFGGFAASPAAAKIKGCDHFYPMEYINMQLNTVLQVY